MFTSSPLSDSIGIKRRRSSQTLSTGPPIVWSSKYQVLMGDLTLLTISSTAKANRAGPERQLQRGLYHGPNGSCLFAAGSLSDTVDSQNF